LAVPKTSGWQTYATVTSSKFLLGAGTWILHIAMDTAAPNAAVGNLDWLKLVPASASTFPAQLKWTRLANAPLARIEANAEQVGGKVYVFGGYNITSPNYLASKEVDVYNLATNTWSRAADMPVGITHLGTATDGRYIYTAGGYVTNYQTGQQTHASTDVWRYDPSSNTWSPFVPLPQARGSGAMVLLGTVLHYFDGYNTSMVAQTSHWMLDLSSPNPQWVAAAPVPAARSHVTASALDGRIYVIGGEAGNTEAAPTTDVFMWDPAHPAAWQRVASLPVARTTAVSEGINGKLIVTGGLTNNFTPLATVVIYDPTTNVWTQGSDPLPAPRERPIAAIINGRLFISTGYQNGVRSDTWITQALD
jgi:N-acetylneuraminic acid mutarotase